jgi:hypothetical protein
MNDPKKYSSPSSTVMEIAFGMYTMVLHFSMDLIEESCSSTRVSGQPEKARKC